MQLLAIETTTVYETGPTFWMKTGDAESVHVDLIRPDTANWGYDVVIWGMGTMDRVHLEHG